MSRNAEDYAVSLAKAFGAEVHLLHVYREFIPATVGPEPWAVTAVCLKTDLFFKSKQKQN
jgi:nucleotide-binding universal stress UspA family protein